MSTRGTRHDDIAMSEQLPTHRERQVLDYLRGSPTWIPIRRLRVPLGDRMSRTLQTKDWMELRQATDGPEIKITRAGLDAVRKPLGGF